MANDFKVFDTNSTNIMSIADYTAASARSNGVSVGVADETLYNRAQRQASLIAAMVAQWMSDTLAQDVLDAGTDTSVLEAQFIAALKVVGRIKLTAPLNLYVSATGSDTLNTGLAIGSPFLTIQHAYNVAAAKYDLQGFQAIINVADGAYTAGISAQGALVNPSQTSPWVEVQGNPGTPGNVTVTANGANCFTATQGAFIELNGIALSVTGSSQAACISAVQGGTIAFKNLSFGAINSASAHITAQSGGTAIVSGNYNITAGGGLGHYAASGGGIQANSFVVTLTGTPVFSVGFAAATHGGGIYAPAMTYTGAATGPRYSTVQNAWIDTNGGGPNYFPGSSAGSSATGGQYN